MPENRKLSDAIAIAAQIANEKLLDARTDAEQNHFRAIRDDLDKLWLRSNKPPITNA